MVRIVLVRHGQTEWNRVERFRGRADIPLNDTGVAQAEAASRRIARTWPVSAVYSSPLQRSWRTAQAIAAPGNLPVYPLEGLLDIDYGEWQGLSPEEVRQRWPALATAWYSDPSGVQIPGGESLATVRTRAMAGVESVIAGHPGQTIALVSHLVICRVLILAMLGLDNRHFWRIRQETAAINVFEWEGGAYTVVTLNDTCHLTER